MRNSPCASDTDHGAATQSSQTQVWLVVVSYRACCSDLASPRNAPGAWKCVAIWPAEGALHLALPQIPKPFRQGSKVPRRIPSWVMAAGVAVLFFGIVGYAKAVGLWDSHIPAAVYRQFVPHANTARHAMPGDQTSE